MKLPLRITALAITSCLLAACVTTPPPEPRGTPIPQSPWAGGFVFQYQTPRISDTPFPVNIAVVNPNYREEESAFLAPVYARVGRGLSASMGADFEKLLVAKGMTATGPFPALDEITYSEKRGASLVFAPRLFITTKLEYKPNWQPVKDGFSRLPSGVRVDVRGERHFEMTVTGWISFIMQEPLSGEKMWIRRLEIEPIVVRGLDAYVAVPETRTEVGFWGGVTEIPTGSYLITNEMFHDGRADALATALAQVYPVVMERFWRLVEPEEMLVLQRQGEEIRALKVY
ncbi:MAG: hypothetical protein WD081_04540 [Gammaproteobacteria bacterium]